MRSPLCALGRAAVAAALVVMAFAVAPQAQAADHAGYKPLPGGRFDSVLPQGPSPSIATPVDVAPFSMRRTPVTVAEYLGFLRAHPRWQRGRVAALFAGPGYLAEWAAPLEPGPAVHPDSPVVSVSWFAAQAYCEA
jgi:formylglycine-generating enzyme required for sulfatase activity